MGGGLAARVRRLRIAPHKIGNTASFVNVDIGLFRLRSTRISADKTYTRVEEVEEKVRRRLSRDRGRSARIGLMVKSRLPNAQFGVRKLVFPESWVKSFLTAKDASVFVQYALSGKLETSYSSFKHYSIGHVVAGMNSYAMISRECDEHIEAC